MAAFDFHSRFIGGIGADAETADTPRARLFGRCQRHDAVHVRQGRRRQVDANGPCAENWPALAAADDPSGADMTIVVRDDGKENVGLQGQALYTFKKDTAPGETNGRRLSERRMGHMATP